MKKTKRMSEVKVMRGVLALFCAILVTFAQVSVFAEEEVTSTPTPISTKETQESNFKAREANLYQMTNAQPVTPLANPGDYLISPETIGVDQDGYAYITPGKVSNQFGEEVWQIFSYNYGHSSGGRTDPGWTAYVPSGSKTLFLVGDLSNHLTLGVGNTTNSTNYVYKTAIFTDNGYTGDIIKIEGAQTGSMLLTNTGEIWYTGDNDSYRFGLAADSRTSAEKNKWVKMDLPSNVDGTVVDAVLTRDSIFIVTSSGHLYGQGGELNYYFGASNHKLPTDPNWTNRTQDFRRVVLPDGSSAKRLWALGATEDDFATQFERAFIVATDTGYFGAGESANGRKLVGVGTNGEGLHKIQYGNQDGTKVDMPANFAKQIEMYGDFGITHFLATNGKVYTTGYSQWGNVAGTRYTNFTGWPTTSTIRYGNTFGSTATSSPLNRWNTNQFEENIDLVDVKRIFPGILTISYEKTDGTIVMGSEIGAAAGSSIQDYQANGVNYDFTQCLSSNDWCYTYYSLPIEGTGSYYYQSTNWNKTALMQRQYIVGLWMGSLAVDQDGFLRAAVRSRSFEETAARSQLIFPVITQDSTIRATENYSSVNDSTYLSSYYNNTITNYRNNARVVGEYMLYSGINLAQPTHTYFDGTTEDNKTNPKTVAIGPFYGKKYGLDPSKPGQASYDIYTNYAVYAYDPATETRTSVIVSPTNAKVTDEEVVLNVEAYAPGTYEIESYRYVTDSDGFKYTTVNVSSYFEVTPAPRLTVPPLTVITTDGYKIKQDSGVSALVQPDQDVTSRVYIEGYTSENTQLGSWTTGLIDGVEKNTEFTLNPITEYNAGIYRFNFKVEVGGYSDAQSGVYVVNDGQYEVGTEYILRAKDFRIGYGEFLNTDEFIKSEANVKVYDLEGNDVTSNVTVSVSAPTWAQEYGSTHSITFSIQNTDGTTLSKTVSGYIDNKPYFIFTPEILELTYGEITADSYKTGAIARDDEDGDIADFTVSTDLTTLGIGVYNVDYTVVDSDLNQTTESRIVIISDGNFVIGQTSILYAKDYQIRKSEYADVTATILSQAQVKVYKIDDGSDITSSVGFNVTRTGYVNEIGMYDIVIKATHDDDAQKAIKAEIITGEFPVFTVEKYTEVEKDSVFSATSNVSVSDVEDGAISTFTVDGTVDTSTSGVYVLTYSATDTDGNTTTETRVVLVKGPDYVTGDSYILKATNFEKVSSDVSVADADILIDAQVEVYDKTTGETLVAGDLVSINKGTYSSTVNTYTIAFTIASDSTINKTVTATVTNGDFPVLTVPSFTEVGLDGEFDPTTGVSATDTEDGTITNIARDVQTLDTSVAGVTVITYTVQDSDGNQVTAKQVVLVSDEEYSLGNQYILFAADFEKLVSEVATEEGSASSESFIISSAQTKVWDKTTGEELTTLPAITVVKNGYTSVPSIYTIDLTITSDPTATRSVDANVTSGGTPVISFASAVIEVQLNDSVDVTTGVTASDPEDGNITSSIVADPTSVDTSTAGVYTVKYTVKDSDGNEEEAIRIYVVNDGTYSVGTEYILKAESFQKRISEVDTTKNAIITDAQVKVYSVETGLQLTGFDCPALTIDKGTYTNAVGTYSDVKISITSELTTNVTVTATVIAGDGPVISGPTYTEVALNASFDPLAGISGTDTEDGTVTVVANPTSIDTSSRGVHSISYSTTDSDGNTATHQRVVVVNDGTYIIGDNYILRADDFTVRLSLVNSSDSAIINEAKIEVFDKSSGVQLVTADVVVIDKGGYGPIAQDYNIGLTVTGDNVIDATIVGTVDAGDPPVVQANDIVLYPDPNSEVVLTTGHSVYDDYDSENYFLNTVTFNPTSVDSTDVGIHKINYSLYDSDLNVVSGHFFVVILDETISFGDKYIIQATDFEKRISEVGSADVQEIKNSSGFIAYNRETGDDVSDTINISVDTGGYTNQAGTYTIKFSSSEDENLNLTIEGVVIAGDAPVITLNPEIVTIQKGGTFTATEGVTVSDDNDTIAVGDITITNPVDVNSAGVYQVTYSVTDSDGNTTEKNRVVIVSDETIGIGDTYIIQANPFSKRISEVTDTSDQALLDASQVKVYDKATGELVSPRPAITVVNGGYVAVEGTYNLVFTVTSDIAATVNSTATVTAGNMPVLTVTDFTEINVNDTFDAQVGASATDTEDGTLTVEVVESIDPSVPGVQVVKYRATDSDGNIVTAEQIVVVNDGSFVVGDTYLLRATNFTKYTDDVVVDGAVVALEAKTEVYLKATGERLSDPETLVTVTLGDYSSTPGDYSILIELNAEAISKTIVATVSINEAPVITFEAFTEISLNDVFDVLAGVSATDAEDGNLEVLSSVESIDTSVPGAHSIVYTAEDSYGNIVTETRVVLVNDGTYVVGTNYIIKANNFEKRVSQVELTKEAVINASSPIVIEKETGLSASVNALVDVNFGTYQAAVGVYSDVVLFVIGDAGAQTTVTATVVEDPLPPTPTPPTNLGCGVNSEWNEDLKQCVCDEGYSNWQGAGQGCLVATPTPTPVPTATPEPTPEVTETPEPTVTPEITPTPEATMTPRPTEDPVPVTAGNENSIANFILLLLSLIVTAWIAVRKFKGSTIVKVLSGLISLGLVILAINTTNFSYSWDLFTQHTFIFVLCFVLNLCLAGVSLILKDSTD